MVSIYGRRRWPRPVCGLLLAAAFFALGACNQLSAERALVAQPVVVVQADLPLLVADVPLYD